MPITTYVYDTTAHSNCTSLILERILFYYEYRSLSHTCHSPPICSTNRLFAVEERQAGKEVVIGVKSRPLVEIVADQLGDGEHGKAAVLQLLGAHNVCRCEIDGVWYTDRGERMMIDGVWYMDKDERKEDAK